MISQSKATKSEYKYKLNSETVPLLADAGADGVVPGSLVLKAPDPVEALAWIRSLATGNPVLEMELGIFAKTAPRLMSLKP